MKKLAENKITKEQVYNLALSKMMIEENRDLMNFLISKDVINKSLEIDYFKEKIDCLKNLIEKILYDKSSNMILKVSIKEVTENELLEELQDIKKIKNKKISAKYKKMLKDNLAMFFDLLRHTNIEDIAMMYNIKLYPIQEMEEIYKYI